MKPTGSTLVCLLALVALALSLPTQTSLDETTVFSQAEFNDETTQLPSGIARQEEGGPGGSEGPDTSGPGGPPEGSSSGPDGPPPEGSGPDASGPDSGPPAGPGSGSPDYGPPPQPGAGEEDEDEEEEEEEATTLKAVLAEVKQPVNNKKKLNYKNSNRKKVTVPPTFNSEQKEINKDEEDVKEEAATVIASSPSPVTEKSSSVVEEWALVTGNVTAQKLVESSKTTGKPPPVPTTAATFLNEWSSIVGNESSPDPQLQVLAQKEEKLFNQLLGLNRRPTGPDNKKDGVEAEEDDLQRSETPTTSQPAPPPKTFANTQGETEKEWALVTDDTVLSDPQARAGCECGSVPFVVPGGGVNEWPWTAAVVRNNFFAGGRPHCGATLINSKYVLTAAHCVDGLLPYHTQVWLTVHDNLGSAGSSSGTLKMEAEKILMHPNYNRRTQENDIALVSLLESVPIGQSSYFVPACVPAGKNEYSEFVGKMAAWGSGVYGNNGNNRIQNNKLCKKEMPILNNDVCDRDTAHSGKITRNMLCAGFLTPKTDTSCVGDAGGGLIISNGGRHTLVGVTSFGYTPSNKAYSPTVFTRVSEYAEWILHNSRDASWCD